MRLVPHRAELPVPKLPTDLTLSDRKSSNEDLAQANKNMDCDPTFAGVCSSNEPHLLTKVDLNDIVRDLNLSKNQAELLGSSLKGWDLLCQDTKMCFNVGTMKNSRISSSRKMVSCFTTILVLLWKCMAINITQISGACSLVGKAAPWQVDLKYVGRILLDTEERCT
jgi:hypothetical protein